MAHEVTFAQGMAKLNATLTRMEALLDRAEEVHRDRAEIACERCGYWPCVCGDPEFETFVSQELNKAAEVE